MKYERAMLQRKVQTFELSATNFLLRDIVAAYVARHDTLGNFALATKSQKLLCQREKNLQRVSRALTSHNTNVLVERFLLLMIML